MYPFIVYFSLFFVLTHFGLLNKLEDSIFLGVIIVYAFIGIISLIILSELVLTILRE